MRQFFAMLKDSFYEAVDGFVIYVMLVLSALVILVVGSLSFTPVEPEQAFDDIVENFRMVFPEKGRSRVITAGFDTNFKAADVQRTEGGYKLRVTVTGRSNTTVTDDKGTRPDVSKGDSFRQMVAGWSRPAGLIEPAVRTRATRASASA